MQISLRQRFTPITVSVIAGLLLSASMVSAFGLVTFESNYCIGSGTNKANCEGSGGTWVGSYCDGAEAEINETSCSAEGGTWTEQQGAFRFSDLIQSDQVGSDLLFIARRFINSSGTGLTFSAPSIEINTDLSGSNAANADLRLSVRDSQGTRDTFRIDRDGKVGFLRDPQATLDANPDLRVATPDGTSHIVLGFNSSEGYLKFSRPSLVFRTGTNAGSLNSKPLQFDTSNNQVIVPRFIKVEGNKNILSQQDVLANNFLTNAEVTDYTCTVDGDRCVKYSWADIVANSTSIIGKCSKSFSNKNSCERAGGDWTGGYTEFANGDQYIASDFRERVRELSALSFSERYMNSIDNGQGLQATSLAQVDEDGDGELDNVCFLSYMRMWHNSDNRNSICHVYQVGEGNPLGFALNGSSSSPVLNDAVGPYGIGGSGSYEAGWNEKINKIAGGSDTANRWMLISNGYAACKAYCISVNSNQFIQYSSTQIEDVN